MKAISIFDKRNCIYNSKTKADFRSRNRGHFQVKRRRDTRVAKFKENMVAFSCWKCNSKAILVRIDRRLSDVMFKTKMYCFEIGLMCPVCKKTRIMTLYTYSKMRYNSLIPLLNAKICYHNCFC